jgi:glycosyltransferase involved in cell wall biosynthesis
MVSANAPVISVVVPTKGRIGPLERCLEALRGSRYPAESFEVVVVNDRGGERVEALVRRFDDVLDVATTSPSGTGPSAARNAGALEARGRHVAFTDDDCEPAPEWLSALEAALVANEGAAVGGEVRNGVPESTGAVATQMVVDALQAEWNRDPNAPRFFPSSNVAFPLQDFRAIGGFDEGFRYAEDRELCERWVRSGRAFVHARDAVVIHMRSLGPREFAAQHFGYGRGAFAFQRRWAQDGQRRESPGVIGELGRAALRGHPEHGRMRLSAYAALSQLATAAGFAREAIGARRRS